MKLWTIFIMTILCASIALANNAVGGGNGPGADVSGTVQASFGDSEAIPIENKITGLENAQLRVRNEEQKQLLEQVMNKIEERARERLNQYEDLTIDIDEDDEITAQGFGEKRFLGILPVKARYVYQIQQDGELQYQRQWYDNLFTLEEEIK